MIYSKENRYYRHPSFKRYFAEEVLIEKWKWDATTYSLVEENFDQVEKELYELWRSETAESLKKKIPENFEGTKWKTLRENIRLTAIQKILYQMCGTEIFEEVGFIGYDNNWVEVDKSGNRYKIGKVISRKASNATPSAARKAAELLRNEELIALLERQIYPGVIVDTPAGLEDYESSLEIGQRVQSFEQENKIPAFPDEIYVSSGFITEDETCELHYRFSSEWLASMNIQLEELMALGIFPYISSIQKELIAENNDHIMAVEREFNLPTQDQVELIENLLESSSRN